MLRVNPLWSITIEGVEKYKGLEPTVFVANHQSFLDLPLIYMLPWKMKWVAKKELFQIPILGWLVSITGHLSVDRGKRTAINRLDNLVEPLKDNLPVMIFPEGTRSPNGELRRFKSGAFMLAKENGFKVQPMVVNGGHRALPSNSWKLGLRQHFHLSVLDPIDPNNFDSINQLKNHVYEIIEQELNRIRQQEHSAAVTETSMN
jgi:1-acyl-sn-glycerol-3-phosphate acyltransferase